MVTIIDTLKLNPQKKTLALFEKHVRLIIQSNIVKATKTTDQNTKI